MERIIFILFALFVLPAQAYQMDFLKSAPVYYFSNQDLKLYTAAGEKALEKTKDGVKVSWKNPSSDSFGEITPISTTRQNGRTCRTLKIFNSAKGRQETSSTTLCRYPSGWKIPSDG